MNGWKTVRLSEFCRTGTGGTPSRSNLERYYEGGTIPWVKSGELRESVINETEEHVTEAALQETNVKLVPAGALLLAMYGATVGRLGILGVEATTNQAVCHIVPDPKAAEVRFLFHALSNQAANLVARGVGGAQPNISQGIIKDLELALPPLVEQRRIAEMLDKAEALRAKRRAALAQLDTLTQSIFLDMFGDPRANDKGWKKVPIESLISDMRGGAALEPEDFVESGFPILHKGAIKPLGEISLDAKKKTFSTVDYANAHHRSVVNQEVLAVTLRDLVPAGPSIGLVVNLRNGPYDKYLLAQGAYAFRVDLRSTVPEYLVYLSNMPTFRHVLRQNAVGSTQIHIRTPVYLAISIPLPPVELQRKFARRAEVVEKLRARQHASLAELDSLFTSLQSRAFNGEL